MAAARPAPAPLTNPSIWRIPFSIALRAAISAVICAAYGVLLREPLKPFCPALDQQTTLPDGSVIVTIVLLNVLWICAWPRGTFFFSRRLPRWRFAATAAPAFACCFALLPPSSQLSVVIVSCQAHFATGQGQRTTGQLLFLSRLLLDTYRLALAAAAR